MSKNANPQPSIDALSFQQATNVSRETLERLVGYEALLRKWNSRINLVGKSTLEDVWRRHFLDSAQLIPHIPPNTRRAVDIGSGAGLPGLVLAACTDLEIHLVESDQRKSAFLREAARIVRPAGGVHVHAKRIEELQEGRFDLITARALADLTTLLGYSENLATDDAVCLFLKGISADTELTATHNIWHIEYHKIYSISDSAGCILKVENIRRVDSPPRDA